MVEGHPPRSPGVPLGYAIFVALLLLDGVFLYLLLNMPITILSFILGLATFLSLPALGFVAYWTAALSRARYLLGGDSLRIEWGPFLRELPLEQTEVVHSGETQPALSSFRGLRWPGYLLGRGNLDGDGEPGVAFFATRPPPAILIISAGSDLYGLSPESQNEFRLGLESAIANAEPQPRHNVLKRDGWLAWPVWRDRAAVRLLLLAPVLNGLHFAALAAFFPGLPASVPLRMDGGGTVLLSGAPARLFLPPFFALFTWLFDAALGLLFYQRRREPVVAYLLWGAAVIVQFAAWASLLLLLP
jgi:hypothetical protein